MARRAGAGEWILRIGLLVLVGVVVWYGLTHLPFGNAGPERPLLYDHDGYEGRPDRPLAPSQVEQLQQRVRSQGY